MTYHKDYRSIQRLDLETVWRLLDALPSRTLVEGEAKGLARMVSCLDREHAERFLGQLVRVRRCYHWRVAPGRPRRRRKTA